jgi:hypothetical protein
MKRPVERKVYAASIGAGAGLTVSNFALWAADSIWWPSPDANVPDPVAGFVELVVTVGLAFLGGWLAKHDPGYVEIDQVDTLEPLPEV